MKDFTLDGFCLFLAELPAKVLLAEHRGLEKSAKMIEHEAKELIGQNHEEGAGPFPAWAKLSDATEGGFWHQAGFYVPGKTELGYPADQPLLREGQLRDSIKHVVHENEAAIGSDDEVAVYQELGTPNAVYPIPPRSFLGRAAYTEAEKVAEAIAGHVAFALRGLPLGDE